MLVVENQCNTRVHGTFTAAVHRYGRRDGDHQWMDAALIPAAFALFVVIIDRQLLARDERRRWERADKRHIYAKFWGAWFGLAMTANTGKPVEVPKEELGLAFGELQLVAAQPVVIAADALVNRLLPTEPAHTQVHPLQLQQRFIDAARRDLGY